MNTEIRLKLDTGSRVQGFCRANPHDDPSYVRLVVRLDDRMARAGTLAEQEHSGHQNAHASVLSKDDLRSIVRDNLLVLSSTARLIALDQPGTEARVVVPEIGISHRGFLAASRACLSQVLPMKVLFLQHAVSQNFLDDLTKLVDQYEGAVNSKEAAQSTHVGAHAELHVVVAEIMRIIHLLGRINRVRLRKDAERLAAWKFACDVHWPHAAKPAPPSGNGPGTGIVVAPTQGFSQ